MIDNLKQVFLTSVFFSHSNIKCVTMQSPIVHQEILSPTLRDDKKMELPLSPGSSSTNCDYSKIQRNSVHQVRDVDFTIQKPTATEQLTPEQLRVDVNSYTLIGDRYVLCDNVEGSTMYKCVDYTTQEEFVCKVSSAKIWFQVQNNQDQN